MGQDTALVTDSEYREGRLTRASHTLTVLSHDAVNKANQVPVFQIATEVTGP
jgi:hypothetical protein